MWPAHAHCEVMDKEFVPWSPVRLIATLLAIGSCALLTRLGFRSKSKSGWLAVVAAIVLGTLWATLNGFDDFYSSDVGPVMRVELGSLAALYAVLLPLEAAAPLLSVFVAIGTRAQSSSRSPEA